MNKKQAQSTNWQLDDEEREIMVEFESGKLARTPRQKQQLRIHRHIAKNTLQKIRKDKNVNIRLSEIDIDGLKMRANEAGIPYQTLMTIVLRQVAKGKIRITL